MSESRTKTISLSHTHTRIYHKWPNDYRSWVKLIVTFNFKQTPYELVHMTFDKLIEGSLEVKLPTIWTDEKQSRAEAERREKIRREKSRRERVRRKKMQMREKVGKSPNTVFFQWFEAPIWGSGGSKSRLTKAAGAEPAGQMRDEKLHAVVARRTFRSQNVQNTSASDHFWKLRCRKSARRCGAKHISKSKCTKHTILGPLLQSWDVEKVRAVVARSTFRSQHVQNTSFSDHFWKLRCRKSAHRCGAKHISKSKCTKHHMFAPLLDVQMSKKCTPLRREAHFEVIMLKTPGADHFWRFRCRFAWQAQGIVHLVRSEQHVRAL